MRKIIEQLIVFVFDLLDSLTPKKRYIVFSTRSANDYADNSKVLFEHFLSQKREDVFFYTKRKDVLRKIPRNGIYAYSFKGVYILLRSRMLFFTHGSSDYSPFNPKKNRGRIFVNLFHAIAVKKVGHRNNLESIKEAKKWDYFLVSSEFESLFIQQQYSLKPEQILVTGQPRNDALASEQKPTKNDGSKLFLYAPTFRDTNVTTLLPFADKDIHKLDDFLGDINTKIMIRLHINEEKVYVESGEYENLKNIFFAGFEKHPSVNDILPWFDGLITDYSSICLDYLLLNRPIGYIPYDYDAYDKERGFSFDYYEHLAGPALNSQKELEIFLKLKEDTFAAKRSELKNLFHTYQDGKASERLYNVINAL
jgi:CDP-glycerol glycerophosphotransferase (TagB/SpsB family)